MLLWKYLQKVTKERACKLLKNQSKLWLRVIGTRGAVGKKTINSSAQFNALLPNKALVVGTGFGNPYKSIYESMGWQVTTIDIADYKNANQ